MKLAFPRIPSEKPCTSYFKSKTVFKRAQSFVVTVFSHRLTGLIGRCCGGARGVARLSSQRGLLQHPGWQWRPRDELLFGPQSFWNKHSGANSVLRSKLWWCFRTLPFNLIYILHLRHCLAVLLSLGSEYLTVPRNASTRNPGKPFDCLLKIINDDDVRSCPREVSWLLYVLQILSSV